MLLDECFRVTWRTTWYLEIAEIQRDLDRFLSYDNLDRSHQGYRLRGRTPAQAYARRSASRSCRRSSTQPIRRRPRDRDRSRPDRYAAGRLSGNYRTCTNRRMLAVCLPSCYRHINLQIKRKSHNLDAHLLRRAQRALGTPTETETIHQALRAVLLGEHVVAALESTSGRVRFRGEFIKQMRRERRRGS
jgi:Arc/MetJ family transcription regulator